MPNVKSAAKRSCVPNIKARYPESHPSFRPASTAI